MKDNKYKKVFSIIAIIAVIVFLFSIFDVVFDLNLRGLIIILYIILVILLIIIIICFYTLQLKELKNVNQFEKTLEGGLYHFKCPTCNGIFALKRSKSNDNKPVTLSCPDCGTVGVITPNPISIEEEIPEKKSMKVNFKCDICGEGITVWAEGTGIYQNNIPFGAFFTV